MKEFEEKNYCDLCQDKIEKYSESYNQITYKILSKDICQDCQEEIIKLLLKNNSYFFENNPKIKCVLREKKE